MAKSRSIVVICLVLCSILSLSSRIRANTAKKTLEERVTELENAVAKLQASVEKLSKTSRLVPDYVEKVTSKTQQRGDVIRQHPYWGPLVGPNPYRPYPTTYAEYQYQSYTRRYHPEQEKRDKYERIHGGREVAR